MSWLKIPKKADNPVFRASYAQDSGILEQERWTKYDIHFNAELSNTELLFRTINSANQLSIYGAVADWCEDLAEKIPGQTCPHVDKSMSYLGSSKKNVRTVSHAYVVHFPKLGSGAMGSRIREQLTHWTDPAVFSQLDQWKGFLSAMVTAHEADLLYMRNFLEEITKNNYNQGGLTLKDLKPDTFESNE